MADPSSFLPRVKEIVQSWDTLAAKQRKVDHDKAPFRAGDGQLEDPLAEGGVSTINELVHRIAVLSADQLAEFLGAEGAAKLHQMLSGTIPFELLQGQMQHREGTECHKVFGLYNSLIAKLSEKLGAVVQGMKKESPEVEKVLMEKAKLVEKHFVEYRHGAATVKTPTGEGSKATFGDLPSLYLHLREVQNMSGGKLSFARVVTMVNWTDPSQAQ